MPDAGDGPDGAIKTIASNKQACCAFTQLPMPIFVAGRALVTGNTGPGLIQWLAHALIEAERTRETRLAQDHTFYNICGM
ncbi:hypothetical protein AJ87_43140 [Rhizobium yanglingense]|nr:hypothetical protein AJ87_43140 [Rhizobium yanglingense]